MTFRLILPTEADEPRGLQQRVYAGLRAAILAGQLAPGARLPASRVLAAELSVARGTVEAAYQRLAGEGYLLARGAAGTFVDPGLAAGRPVRRPPAVALATLRGELPTTARPFQMGLPALDLFPRKLWARLDAARARALSPDELPYQDPAGAPALRQAIAGYLGVARGVACHPDQVFVVAGFHGGLGLIARVLLRLGDAVWVEEPGFAHARQALALAGARTLPMAVDAEGLVVEAARRRAPNAGLALVTPTHQFPLGMTLSLSRRLALLDWAAAAGAWVVEDDYDSEFRYRGRPLPALKSLDTAGRVIYGGTFGKVLFPALRVGYLVVPPQLAERFLEVATLLQPAPSAPLQRTIAAFLQQGHFARHIGRMRTLYGERRQALAAALKRRLGDRLDPVANPGGMHIVARGPAGWDDVAFVARARAAGLAPEPLSASYAGAGDRGLLLSFTNIAAEAADEAARRLAGVF